MRWNNLYTKISAYSSIYNLPVQLAAAILKNWIKVWKHRFLQCIANTFPTLNDVVNLACLPLTCMCASALGPKLELHKKSAWGICNKH